MNSLVLLLLQETLPSSRLFGAGRTGRAGEVDCQVWGLFLVTEHRVSSFGFPFFVDWLRGGILHWRRFRAFVLWGKIGVNGAEARGAFCCFFCCPQSFLLSSGSRDRPALNRCRFVLYREEEVARESVPPLAWRLMLGMDVQAGPAHPG